MTPAKWIENRLKRTPRKKNSIKHTGHIEVDGFTLRYLTEGKGRDALVIGSSIYYPRSFSQNLRKFLRLHFVDYRGFAKGPDMELTFEALLDDIERVRQQLDLKKSSLSLVLQCVNSTLQLFRSECH